MKESKDSLVRLMDSYRNSDLIVFSGTAAPTIQRGPFLFSVQHDGTVDLLAWCNHCGGYTGGDGECHLTRDHGRVERGAKMKSKECKSLLSRVAALNVMCRKEEQKIQEAGIGNESRKLAKIHWKRRSGIGKAPPKVQGQLSNTIPPNGFRLCLLSSRVADDNSTAAAESDAEDDEDEAVAEDDTVASVVAEDDASAEESSVAVGNDAAEAEASSSSSSQGDTTDDDTSDDDNFVDQQDSSTNSSNVQSMRTHRSTRNNSSDHNGSNVHRTKDETAYQLLKAQLETEGWRTMPYRKSGIYLGDVLVKKGFNIRTAVDEESMIIVNSFTLRKYAALFSQTMDMDSLDQWKDELPDLSLLLPHRKRKNDDSKELSNQRRRMSNTVDESTTVDGKLSDADASLTDAPRSNMDWSDDSSDEGVLSGCMLTQNDYKVACEQAKNHTIPTMAAILHARVERRDIELKPIQHALPYNDPMSPPPHTTPLGPTIKSSDCILRNVPRRGPHALCDPSPWKPTLKFLRYPAPSPPSFVFSLPPALNSVTPTLTAVDSAITTQRRKRNTITTLHVTTESRPIVTPHAPPVPCRRHFFPDKRFEPLHNEFGDRMLIQADSKVRRKKLVRSKPEKFPRLFKSVNDREDTRLIHASMESERKRMRFS